MGRVVGGTGLWGGGGIGFLDVISCFFIVPF